MFAMIPRENFIELHMVFRSATIGLAASAGEGVQNDKPCAGIHAPGQGPFVSSAHSEFIDQTRRE